MPTRRSSKHIGLQALPSQTSYFQDGPRLGNQYVEDSFLRATLKRILSEETLKKAESEFEQLGSRVIYELLPLANELDNPETYPRLERLDSWGKNVDVIHTHPNWRYMHRVSAEEGVVADGYDITKWGSEARVVSFAKLFLFAPSSALYSCPLAMVDGAARYLQLGLASSVPKIEQDSVLQNIGNACKNDHDVQEIFNRLTSRNPIEFYTSGQWMTERRGGSDVASGTETIARKIDNDTYELFGYKWFTSATDADVALTLARIENNVDGTVEEGSGGLSCFLVRVRDPNTKVLNNIKVHRLKNKLGTKQLPTAEMELIGTKAKLISLPGRGVAAITTGMVNVTRLHNSISACAAIRRMIALCRDYSHRREVFGSKLMENSIHLKTLSNLELNYRACLSFTMDVVSIFGRVETSSSTASFDNILGGTGVSGSFLTPSTANLLVRLLTPILKAFTAKIAVQSVTEGCESFGGQGYIEDTHLPRILRDAHVLPIWEGTTNVLSHDMLRVLVKSKLQAFVVFDRLIQERCNFAMNNIPGLKSSAEILLNSCKTIDKFIKGNFSKSSLIESVAREITLSIGRIYSGSCLLEHATWSRDQVDISTARRWCCDFELLSFNPNSIIESDTELDKALALDLDGMNGKPRGYGNHETNGRLRAKF